MRISKRVRTARRLLVGTVATLALCASVHAQNRPYAIPAGDMRTALEAYAAQSSVQLVYKIDDLRGLSTQGVNRAASPEEALQGLLQGSPLKARRDANGAVVLFLAQGATAAASASPAQLESVIVSASRRREPASEVPMQVNVLSVENLQRSGAKVLGDYLTTQGGVDLRSEGGAGYGAISIRGVTTGSQTIPTVGVYADDVAVGSSSAFARGSLLFLDLGLLDLNHIELLRGPQGTLYGAGAMGGVLKYVTNVPDTNEFSGRVTLSGSTTKHGNANGTASAVVNLPLKEEVAAVRISAYQDHQGGWVDATGPAGGSAVNRGDSTGARISALVTPTKDLTLRFTATLQDNHRNGYDFVDYDKTTSQPVGGELSRQLSVREPFHVRTNLYSGEVEYDFGWARLNSVTSYSQVDHNATVDASSIYVPLLQSTIQKILGVTLATASIATPVTLKKTTQEFRLTSRSDKQFEWLAGLYYDHEKGSNDQSADTTLVGGAAGPNLALISIPSTYKEYAAFGDATWKFDSGFSLTGGLRFARNQQDYGQASSGLLAGGASQLTADSSDHSTTYLLTGRYALDTTSSVYARTASGYRPGGPNAVLNDIKTGLPLAPNTFKPDSLRSYELGYKADLFAKTLSVEAAVYDIEWKDIQQPFVVNGVAVLTNGGKARIRGSELSATWRPLPAWSVGGNIAYTDGKFVDDAPALGKAGSHLPNTAKFSGSVQGNYNFTVVDYAAYAGATVRFVGSRDAGVPGSTSLPSYTTPGYSLTDLQAGIDIRRFTVGLFARNIFDKRAQTSAYTAFIPLGGNALVSVAQPRTIGVTLSAAF